MISNDFEEFQRISEGAKDFILSPSISMISGDSYNFNGFLKNLNKLQKL